MNAAERNVIRRRVALAIVCDEIKRGTDMLADGAMSKAFDDAEKIVDEFEARSNSSPHETST
jgi:hypothetical protein